MTQTIKIKCNDTVTQTMKSKCDDKSLMASVQLIYNSYLIRAI